MARSDIDFSSRPGSNLIDLGEQGLSNGDNINSYIEDYFDSGNQVYIPPGEYDWNAEAVSGTYHDCALIGDPEGVVLHRPSPETKVMPYVTATGGEVLFENFTERGMKGTLQSRWRPECSGGDITVRNVNYPDGTADPSDSIGYYGEGASGTFTMEDCYFGAFGNSIAYFTYASHDLVVDGCTFQNSNAMIRPPDGHVEVRNCRWFGDADVPNFKEEGSPEGGKYNRFIRVEDNVNPTMLVENCHAYQTTACTAPGPFFQIEASASGTLRDCYLYNETDAWLFSGDFSGFNVSNIHISGGGQESMPFADAGDAMPDTEKTVWTPNGNIPDPSDGGSGGGGSTDPGEGDYSNAEGTVLEIYSDTQVAAWFTVDSGADALEYDAGNGLSTVGDSDVSRERWGDGTMTVNTTVGPSDGDAFDIVGGGIIGFDYGSGGTPTFRWNGQVVTKSDAPLEPVVTDPCADVTCGACEECVDGDCVPITCPDGEECVDGDCVPIDPCADVSCGPCEECVDGVCEPVTCPDGEECVDGDCVPIDDGSDDPVQAGVSPTLLAGLVTAVGYIIYRDQERQREQQ